MFENFGVSLALREGGRKAKTFRNLTFSSFFSYPAAIGRISENVRKAEDMTTRANQTANYATSTVKQKQAEMSLKVLQAERAKNNATQAQITSTEAKAAVDKFHVSI